MAVKVKVLNEVLEEKKELEVDPEDRIDLVKMMVEYKNDNIPQENIDKVDRYVEQYNNNLRNKYRKEMVFELEFEREELRKKYKDINDFK